MSFSSFAQRLRASIHARRAAALMLAAAWCVQPIRSPAAEPPLTLAAAQQLALERSRQLPAYDYAVSSARDMAVAARQLPDPVLKAGIDNLPVSGDDHFSLTREPMTMRRIGVMQEITRADKLAARGRRFEREAEKATVERDMAAAGVLRDSALAWLDRYYAEAMARLVEEQGGQARLELEATEGGYRAGRGSQADVFAARSAQAAIADRAAEMQRRIRNATTMLARWIGDAAQRPLDGKPDTTAIGLDPAALETQMAHHPQLAILAKQEEIAQEEASMAQANRRPDWSVELAYQQRGQGNSNMVSVGVSVPLPWDRANRQDRELSSKLAMVEQARAMREDATRAHVAETRAMIEEWQNDRERHARYERELIPLARERTTASLAAYRGGKAALADVLAARRNEIEVRLQALQLEADTARVWAQINFLSPQAHVPAAVNQDKK